MATGASSTRMVAAGDGVVDIVRRITIGMSSPLRIAARNRPYVAKSPETSGSDIAFPSTRSGWIFSGSSRKDSGAVLAPAPEPGAKTAFAVARTSTEPRPRGNAMHEG